MRDVEAARAPVLTRCAAPQLISVSNDDENKCFGVVLRTPVSDSTGIPHILEHSVLCGSRKFPVKEPFVELMKGSLNTFLNAFTYPDRTCYPVASTNTADFYNLVDVYLDAVYHPRCVADPNTFAQEGWHLELETPGGDITYKGVVFNEMKGVYSSPDSVLGRVVQQALFPGNTYGVDSGGDPATIPQLTFERFADFHARFYHPSNSRLWFYGDDDPEKRLAILDKVLSEFEARDASDSAVATQPLFTSPRRVVSTYATGAADAAGEAEEEEEGEEEEVAEQGAAGAAAPSPAAAPAPAAKTYLTVNWVLSEQPLDTATSIALSFLDQLLLGTAAAPLRRALESSGLGEALTGGGLEDELVQPTYGVGLKGVSPSNVAAVEALIASTLERLAVDGFDPSEVAAAVNTIEFSLRENNTGRFPRGLSLMLRSVSSWLYGRDAFEPLRFEAPLAALKARLDAGDDVFRPLIRRFLIDNPHKVTVELRPDSGVGPAAEAAERSALSAEKARRSEAQLEELVAATEALKARQEAPDTEEALRCMPHLALADIPKAPKPVPTSVATSIAGHEGTTLLTHELATNEIVYAEALLDAQRVPVALLPLLPLFCRALTNMGTTKESFVELQRRIGATTGGVGASTFTSDVRGSRDAVAAVMLRGKATASRAGSLFDVFVDVLTTGRLDDRDRFRQMALQSKAGMEARAVGSGHSIAASRVAATLSAAGAADEAMGGASYLLFLRDLVARIDSDWDGVRADLEAIRSALLCRAGAIVNLTGDAASLSAASPHAAAFFASLPPTSPSPRLVWPAPPPGGSLPVVNELLTVPTAVNYVAKGVDLYATGGYTLHGSAYVANKLIGTSWLWDRVRVSGGAYGGFSDFDPHSGVFTQASYRDPNLGATLDIFDGTPAFLAGLDISRDALDKAIIGTIGDVDGYQLPDAKGYTALVRHLLGVTDEERAQRREEILGTSVADFRSFADALQAAVGPSARAAAVCSPEAAIAAAAAKPGYGFKTSKLV